MYKEVSVIICTYKSDYKKLILTLKSIVCQKEIDYEIIVTDDGTSPDYANELNLFIANHHIKNIRLLYQKENTGTIRNISKALDICNGKYCYLISPGDLLFDEYVLMDFYKFSEKNNYKIVFGNEITYNNELELRIFKKIVKPKRPFLYNSLHGMNEKKITLLSGEYIAGPAYFRKTVVFKKYISILKKHIRYVEDNTSSILAIADNISIDYYDRNIVWYEYGTGISTSKHNNWEKIITDEYIKVLQLICKNKNEKIYKFALSKNLSKSVLDKIICFTKYPLCSIKAMLIICQKKVVHPVSQKDVAYLKEMINWLKLESK